MASYIDQLPEYLQDYVLDSAYYDSLDRIYAMLGIGTGDDTGSVDSEIDEILTKKKQPTEFRKFLEEKFPKKKDAHIEVLKVFYVNFILPFPEYFGDQAQEFQNIGGKDTDFESAPVVKFLEKNIKDNVVAVSEQVEAIDIEKEFRELKSFFRSKIVAFIRLSEDREKRSFDNNLLYVLQLHEGGAQELADELYASEERIGTKNIALEQALVPPSLGNWLKDLISFSGADLTSLSVPKYFSENKNAVALDPQEREVLRRMFEIFRVMREYPLIFEGVNIEDWSIIPHSDDAIVTEKKKEVMVQMRENAATELQPVVPIAVAPVEVQSATRNTIAAPSVSTGAVSIIQTYTTADYEAFARDLLDTSGIVLADPALVARFVALMVTRLRGIRDGIETREKLEAPVDKGGVGLSRVQTDLLRKNANSLIADIHAGKAVVRKKEAISQKEAVVPTQETAPTPAQNTPSQAEKEATAQKWEEKAKQELASLEQKKSEVPQQAKDTKPSADTSTAPTPPPAFEAPKPTPITGRSRTNVTAFGVTGYTAPAQAQPKKTEEQQPAKTSTTSSSHNAIPTPTDLSARSTVMSIEEIDGIPTIVERPASSSKGNATPLTPRPRPRPQQGAQRFEKPGVPINVRQGAGDVSPYKVSVADVTFKPTLVDPIQELKLFTIKDFRRLSKDPHQAAKRIFQKIKLLEQESQTKKAQGIQSWKESEVAKLYAEIGSESFGKGLPLDTVIASRRQAGKETLSEDELDALLELNEMLRF